MNVLHISSSSAKAWFGIEFGSAMVEKLRSVKGYTEVKSHNLPEL